MRREGRRISVKDADMISGNVGAVHSGIVCGSQKSRKKITKNPLFLWFNVIDVGIYPRKARRQCLL